jgi:hypothetical protein
MVGIIMSQKYIEKNLIYDDKIYYSSLKKNILTKDVNTPIIWIHIPYKYNARNWLSFGSRSSFDVNQPYLNLTIKSIIKHCDKDFKICLIDDDSFEKLIPKWNINLSKVGDPLSGYMRQLGLLKLVYYYGGVIVPNSFLCLKNLSSLIKSVYSNNNMFVVENIDRNVTSVHFDYYPDISFMGCISERNNILAELIEFIERKISADYTSQFDFLGEINRWCNKRVQNNRINLVPGNLIGIKTLDDSPVTIEEMLGTGDINFDKNMYGIFIPDKMLLNRTNYQWFVRSSQKQILESNFVLAKYFIEGNSDIKLESFTSKPDWVSFWRVPSRAPVWGLKPKYLGNNIQQMKYPI